MILYTKMTDLFLQTIEQYKMINQGDTVAVCLSGGADSMALFHLMCAYREVLKIDVLAIHINHGLRKESDDEEIFIKEYCKNTGVECIVHHLDMNSKEKPQGFSTEMWARKLRYEFFEKVAEERNAKLATAHTLSDKCETVIFNLSRGTNLKGMCGIPAVRGNIIRPLINCTRKDVEDYCKATNLPYVTDMSNFSEEYSRNKIRLKIMPVLKEINSGSEQLIGEFTQEMEQIYTFLTQLSDTLFRNSVTLNGFDISTIKKQDDVVIKFFLRKVLDRYNCLSKDNIEAILEGIKTESFSRQLSKEILCEIKEGYLSFYKPKVYKRENSDEKTEIYYSKEISFLSKTFVLEKISREELEKNEKIDKNYLNNCIDCDTINRKLFLRTRKTGDVITLRKRNITKTVKKLFTEDKIPLKTRDSMAILSDDDDNVIWLEDYGVNKKFAVNGKTENIMVITKR
ncbi:MAG: tRNA lysidine(34) synthetase TilS [Ruminococcaceae bacterium]|nr:tRNA lysidine(34) synthetase TilS [Oscillospiraceae bacterium]